MAAVKILIVEDNILLQEELASQLKKLGMKVSDRIEKGEEVIASIQSEKPDVIIMDIHLAGEQDGIATAKQVNELYDIPIIYLTDYVDDNTFDKAKLTTPANFLPKPYNIVNLERAIELAFRNVAKSMDAFLPDKNQSYLSGDTFFIKNKHQLEKVKLDEIVYLQAGRSYSNLYTDEGEYLFTVNMKKLASQVPRGIFQRVSRSHIINVNKIIRIRDDTVFLNCGGKELEIKIGSTYRKEFIDSLQKIQ